ncbi:hypothetical protein MASR1M107_12030 [Ignavibacteriales bacterium]
MKKSSITLMLIVLFSLLLAPALNAQGSGKQKDTVFNKTTTTYDEKLRNQADFPKFLKYFLEQTYFEKNFNMLLYNSDKSVTNFFHPVIGFARATNPGAFCVLVRDSTYGLTQPAGADWPKNYISALKLFNKMPKNGFCDESKDKNGAYYITVKKFPEYYDHQKEKAVPYTLPAKYKSAQIMKVVLLVDKWIQKQFYFVKIDKKWYLILSEDCDCSA